MDIVDCYSKQTLGESKLTKDPIKELKLLYEKDLSASFPSDDIVKMEKDFQEREEEIDCFIGDFNEFCDLIAGSCLYVIADKKIPNYQRRFLNKDFFTEYPQYQFIEHSISKYPHFYNELKNFERARVLLVKVIHSPQ